jgi:hypothetical protein
MLAQGRNVNGTIVVQEWVRTFAEGDGYSLASMFGRQSSGRQCKGSSDKNSRETHNNISKGAEVKKQISRTKPFYT